VSINDAEAVKQIYGGEKFQKSPYYRIFLFNVRTKENVEQYVKFLD
jgi:hypothetical protein